MALNSYSYQKEIGKGSFGTVVEVIHNFDNGKYALKIISLGGTGNEDSRGVALHNSVQEIKYLKNLDNKNVVKYYTSWMESSEVISKWTGVDHCARSTAGCLVIQMEYCFKSLKQWLTSKDYSLEIFLTYYTHCLNALDYIHGKKIIHRDLKPGNVLLTRNKKGEIIAKLADFGLAIHEELDNKVADQGTYLYRSPEQASSGQYGTEADMYSMGVILYEGLLHSTSVFENKDSYSYDSRQCARLMQLRQKDLPDDFLTAHPFYAFIVLCLTDTQHERPNAATVLKYFTYGTTYWNAFKGIISSSSSKLNNFWTQCHTTLALQQIKVKFIEDHFGGNFSEPATIHTKQFKVSMEVFLDWETKYNLSKSLHLLFENNFPEFLGLLKEHVQKNEKRERKKTKEKISLKLPMGLQWNLPRKIAHFTGRSDLLEKIHEKLSRKQGSSVLITDVECYGLGGIGKTTLAVEYAWRRSSDFNSVLWMRAHSESNLIHELANFGNTKFGISGTELEIAKEITNILTQSTGWLLILDNIENYNELVKWVPQNAGSVLMTSRYRHLSFQNSLQVEVLSLDESVFMLRRIITIDEVGAYFDEDSAIQFADLLHGLPLALETAANYIKKQRPISIRNYITEFTKSSKASICLLKEYSLHNDNYDPKQDSHYASVYTTWDITERAIAAEFPQADKWLRACAYLHPVKMPHFLVEDFFQKGVVPAAEFLGILTSFSMLRMDNGSFRFTSIHPLIQRVIKDKYENDIVSTLDNLVSTLIRSFPFDRHPTVKKLEDYFKRKELKVHLLAILEEIKKQISKKTPKRDGTTKRFAYLGPIRRFYYYFYPGCNDLKTLKLLEMKILRLLIKCHGSLNDKKGVKDYLRDTLRAKIEYYGPKHILVANSQMLVCCMCKDFDEGISLLKESIALKEILRPENFHFMSIGLLNLAEDLEHIAVLQKDKAKSLVCYKEACDLWERQVDMCEKKFGTQANNFYASRLLNLAKSYKHLGKLVEAETLYLKSLAMTQESLGELHIETLYPLAHLKRLYESLGNGEKVEEYRKKIAIVTLKRYGPEHKKVRRDGNTGKNMEASQFNSMEERIKCYEDSLNVKRGTNIRHPTHHPELAHTYRKLGESYGKKNDFLKAEEAFRSALNIFIELPNSNLALAHWDLGRSLLKLDRYSEAKVHIGKSIELFQQGGNYEPYRLHRAFQSLATVLIHLEEYSNSEQIHQKLLDNTLTLYGENHLEMAKVLHSMARVYVSENQILSKIDCLERSLAIYMKLPKWDSNIKYVAQELFLTTGNVHKDRLLKYFDFLKVPQVFRLPFFDNFQAESLSNYSDDDITQNHYLGGLLHFFVYRNAGSTQFEKIIIDLQSRSEILAKRCIESENYRGQTPLMICALLGNLYIAKSLILAGADIKAVNKLSENAIDVAFKRKNILFIIELLKSGSFPCNLLSLDQKHEIVKYILIKDVGESLALQLIT